MASSGCDVERSSSAFGRSPTMRLASGLFSESQRHFANALTATAREPLIVLDRGLRIVAASSAYRTIFPITSATIEAQCSSGCEPDLWGKAAFELLRTIVTQNAVIEDREVQINGSENGQRLMSMNARRIGDPSSRDMAIVVALEDLTVKRELDAMKLAAQKDQEARLVEVHHRMANSLQIVASILLMKARTVKSDETRFHLNDVHHRIIAVATVQRQLSVSDGGNNIELGPYLAELCEGLASSLIREDQTVTIVSSAANGFVKSEDAVSFGLIVTELVINSLKHGFPAGRGGHIQVAYVTDGGGWRLTTSDDGVGQRSAVPGRSDHKGLGTTIIQALARNLKAVVETRHSNSGTTTAIVHVN